MIKRITALLITLLLAFVQAPAFAQNDAYTFSDSANSIELLADLGIFTASDFSSDKEQLTRAEAARLLVKMTGVGVSSSASLPFTDVEAGNENYAYIAAAYAMKYISGVSATEFAPDALVTKPQVAKIIMSILGYDAPSIASGGYPAGYLKYANEVDLFDGVSLDGSEYITPAEMSNIILNALRAELMIQSSFGDEISYTSYENKNLLSENFDIYIETAVVEADRYTSLYDKSGSGEDEVTAASVTYDASHYSGNVPVGCLCDLYYHQKTSGSKRELLSVQASEENNTVYKLSADNIASASESQLEYEDENGKTKRINISSNAAFIYNGQLAPNTENIFDGCDEVILIDNDKNNSCDVVFIRKYTLIQVKSLSKDSFTVYDKISRQSYSFDDTSEFTTVFYYNGEVTDFYEIEKDSILSVLIPADTSEFYTKHVYVSDEYLEAAIDEINYSQGEVVAGGNTYKASQSIINTVKSGAKYRFGFDVTGKIVTAQNVEEIKNYAYFTAAKSGIFDEVSIQLFSSDGTWLEPKLNKNINYNGTKISSTSIFSMSELFAGGELNPQLIEYTLSSDGLVNSITTATDVTAIRFSDEETDIIGKDEFRLSFTSASARFLNSTGTITFGEKAHLTADAVVMVIPTDVSAKDEFFVTTPDKLTHNISYTGIKLYNCDEYACSPLAMVYDNEASYRGTTPLVVSAVKTVLGEDGETVEKVFGYSRTTYETENVVAEYTSLANMTGTDAALKPGDVIIPVINGRGEITNFERTHNAGVSTYGASSTTIYSDYVTVYGKVIDSSADYVVLDYSADKASFRLYSTSVYVCEKARDGSYTVRLGSVSDLNVDDDVVIRSYYMRGTVAVVYKK